MKPAKGAQGQLLHKVPKYLGLGSEGLRALVAVLTQFFRSLFCRVDVAPKALVTLNPNIALTGRSLVGLFLSCLALGEQSLTSWDDTVYAYTV